MLVIVSPETVVRWHRAGFHMYWRLLSRVQKQGGRRPVTAEIRELILKMLQQTRWNRKETAEILGISYKALLYKIKENGLDKAS